MILRKMRRRAGFSQEALAVEMNYARTTISKMENNKLELKARDLLQWSKITQSQEMLAALICGVDPTTIQQIMDTITSTPIVGTIIKWGGYMQCIINF